MNKLTANIEKYLLPVANKIGGNRILKAISGAFSTLMPIIMVGAISSLLTGLNVGGYQEFITNIGLKEIIGWITACTTNMMAVYVVFLIAKNMAESMESRSHSTIVGIVALLAFMLNIPIVDGAMSVSFFGAPGLFTAMLIGVIVPLIYNIFIKHNIVIKMPDGVPPQISTAFSGIIPAAVVAIVFVALRAGLGATSWGTLNGMIYGILKAPLSSLSNSPFTFMLLLFLVNLLWFFGIHGGMVVMPFLSMLYTASNLENLDAFAQGLDLPNMITQSWWFGYGNLGGSGAIISLAIIMAFLARSQRYKTLGRIAFVPSLVNISEPVVFGLPLVLNVVMFIPMILVPLINAGLSYVLTAIGVLPYLNGFSISVGMPVVMSGFLAGGWRAALWQIVLVLLDIAIYLPFFRILDKQAMAEEAKGTVEA